MSSLTGQQINQSYQGLLKLDNSSSGITQNLQAVEDGLGNKTGLRIAIDQFESKNMPTYVALQGRYYGSGFNTTNAASPASTTINVICASPFYDNGDYSYSAISINVVTASTTSETIEAAIYSTQIINPTGLYPYAPIVSGITFDISTTGVKTYTFPSNISMSGFGGGIYFFVYKITGASTASFRGGTSTVPVAVTSVGSQIYGLVESFIPNIYSQTVFRGNNPAGGMMVFSGATSFANPFSTSVNTAQRTDTTVTGNQPGFLLHSVGA